MDKSEFESVYSEMESDSDQAEPVASWSVSSFPNSCFFESVSSDFDSTKSDEDGALDIIVLKGWSDLLVVFQPFEWDFIVQCFHSKIYVLFLTVHLQKLHFKYWSRSKNIHQLNTHHQDTESCKTKQTNHRTGWRGRADAGKRHVHIMAECWLYKQRRVRFTTCVCLLLHYRKS